MAKGKRRASSTSDVNKKSLELLELPREIVAEIMSRFTTKSLMLFKLVSKSWCSVIRSLVSDPGFIPNRPTILILNEPSPRKDQTLGQSSRKIFSTLFTAGRTVVVEKKGRARFVTKSIDVSDNPSRDRVRVLYCDGIVCVGSDRGSPITLYSPAMNESIDFRPKPVDGETPGYVIEAIGFGSSDSESTSFKLVRIVWDPRSRRTAQVYEMGGDTWRKIEFPLHVSKWMKNELCSEAVYAKGRCRWLVEDPPMCLCFDVAAESFRAVDLPIELVSAKCFRSHTRLVAREGSLWLVFYPPWQPVEVWVMNNNQDSNESFPRSKWVKMENPPKGLGKPFYHRSSDEIVVRTGNGHGMSYNIGARAFQKLSPNGDLGRIHYFGPHIDNFASVKWMIKHARSNDRK